MTYLKRNPVIGLILGVALVAMALLSLPLVSKSADAASAPTGRDCPVTRVHLDDGYGLTRTAYVPTCP